MPEDKTRKGQEGFTLIELLVSLAIIAVLVAIVLTVIGGSANKKNATAISREAQSIISGQGLYKSDLGSYPSALNTLWDRNAVPVSFQPYWKGPYYMPSKTTNDGNIADQRVAGVEYRYTRITTSGGTGSCSNASQIGITNTGGIDHTLRVSNVPLEVARIISDNFGLKACVDSTTDDPVNVYFVIEELW
jgi:prepilin-type N-terminal cleavage/methylation domain-containing protein